LSGLFSQPDNSLGQHQLINSDRQAAVTA